MSEAVDLRCPENPSKLLAKLRLTGEQPTITDGNLMELHCRDCTQRERQQDPSVRRVLHRYNFLGELIESSIDSDQPALF